MKSFPIRWLSVILLTWALPLAAQAPEPDPSESEVILGHQEGWQSSLVYDAGVGVWAVQCYQLLPQLGCPELLACDDRGRATILISYSGKWTPKVTVTDGKWLAPSVQGHFGLGAGTLLVGGAGGRLYEVKPRDEGHSDCLLRAEFPGEEIHSLVNLPMSARLESDITIVFLKSGRSFSYAVKNSQAVIRELPQLEGRVRDVVLESVAVDAGRAIIWTVSRRGQAVRRHLSIATDGTIERRDEVVLDEPMGLGRISAGAGKFAGVYYVTRDDGVYLRLHQAADGKFKREVFFVGDQGPRGLVAGRFDPDPEVETVAIFGYSGRVELLSRNGEEAVTAATIFEDEDKGHWLTKAELDGRNETEEIVSSGFSGRVVLLSRYLSAKSEDEDAKSHGKAFGLADAEVPQLPLLATEPTPRAPIRIAVPKLPRPEALDSLSYGGGFLTKTATYATLLQRGNDGKLLPGLATKWWYEDEGKTWVFELAKNHLMHDGSFLSAQTVINHFNHVVGDQNHQWLGLSRYLQAMEARTEHEIVFRLDRPWALEEELVAVNPCGIRAPASFDAQGGFRAPLGSGPLRPQVETQLENHLVYVDSEGRPIVELVAAARPEQLLEKHHVDLIVDDWDSRLDVDRVKGSVSSFVSPGSSVYYLSFNPAKARGQDLELRRSVVRALGKLELPPGLDPAQGWAAPSISSWPKPIETEVAAGPLDDSLTLLVDGSMPWSKEIVSAIRGIPDLRLFIIERTGSNFALTKSMGAYDLILERTWGLPYDPFLSLAAAFDPAADETAASKTDSVLSQELQQLVHQLMSEPKAEKRWLMAAAVQQKLDEEALIVPLAVPQRRAFYHGRFRFPADLLGPNIYELPLDAIFKSLGY